MSTHAVLGVQFDDGEILGCYVHFDGYTLGERLTHYLKTHTTTDLTLLITEAQSSGGMRSFHCPPYDPIRSEDIPGPAVTEFLDDNVPYIITAQNWEDDHMGSYYRYLVNYESGTFYTIDRGKKWPVD